MTKPKPKQQPEEPSTWRKVESEGRIYWVPNRKEDAPTTARR